MEAAALGALVLVVGAVTVTRLPVGICYGDSGGLQLAAATLGITHPPGYPGYATLGFLVSRLPFADPAYAISLACWLTGLAALVLCALTQIRLGVNAWFAAAVCVGLTAYSRVWTGLLRPEVYMPSLAFVAGAVYLLMRHAARGRWRDLAWGAFLWGLALANRIPVVLTLPFIVLGYAVACRKSARSRRECYRGFALAVAAAALPGVYSLAYLYLRDTPTTAYNYIEQYNEEMGILPPTTDGFAAKVHRVVWQASGRQFQTMLARDWRVVRAKLRWIANEVFPVAGFTMYPLLLVVVLAAALAFQRSAPAACWLLGMAVGSMAFVAWYRIHGEAADLLPALYALGVGAGLALSPVFPRACSPRRQVVAALLLALTAGATVMHLPRRPARGLEVDAAGFLARVDLPTLPPGTIICSNWANATPLWYAQRFLTPRPDVSVINATESNWFGMVADKLDRPVFAISDYAVWEGYRWEPYRNLWRPVPIPSGPEPAPPSGGDAP
ncbi:MAG: DUF2723 domain-containing protein [Planctomycetes bacterium]|nr:DUF2723 domain-containing protein [Planctomycetota bacterium]